MSTPTYKKGERVHFLAEGTVSYVRHTPCEAPYPGALTIAVSLEGGGTYDVTVPLGAVTIERLDPAGGEPQPGQLWADATGEERYACGDSRSGEIHLTGPDGTRRHWRSVHRDPQLGPITRVYPPAPAADTTSGQAEETSPGQADEPRLMLGDVWEDGDDEGWRVAAMGEELRLALGHPGYPGYPCTWGEVDGEHGPLTLVQRAGYRPTGGTVPAGRLTIGMVVSCPDWVGGAPVRLTAPADGTERAYELFGDGETGVGTAAPAALFTVWEPVGGAR